MRRACRIVLGIAAGVVAPATARAERLDFDQRLRPALAVVVAADRPEMVHFEDASPRYVLDRIAVQGRSANDWQEMLEIRVLPHGHKPADIDAWYASWQHGEDSACPSVWSVVARDAGSITLARSEAQCTALAGQTRLYRAVYGKRDVFVLTAAYRGTMDAAMRGEWLALLASAHLAG